MRLLVLLVGLLVLFSPAAQAQDCTGPEASAGTLLFNSDHDVFQGCTKGAGWVAFHEATGYTPPPSGPTNCDNIGDTCDDGSIYAGLSPDGNVPMYTTPADAASLYTWNDGTVNYTNMTMENCVSAESSCDTGEANTAFLVGATGEPDYPFAAAEYCNGLSAHGQSDWYLPARDELAILRTNRVAIGGFDLSGSYPAGWYWSSSERNNYLSWRQRFSDGNEDLSNKRNGLSVRCVRR